MLACPQDILFRNEINRNVDDINGYQSLILNSNNTLLQGNLTSDFQHKDKKMRHHLQNRIDDPTINSNDSLKDKEEQVWPSDVESAFIEALESIPKLGRRKILVNGKPCGRNELISDFIFRKTCKVRTRKQVSSHIQVLKNTRKGDTHFMRLLTDSVDGDENNNNITVPNRNVIVSNNNSKPKMRQTQHARQPFSVKNNCKAVNNTLTMKSHNSNDNLSSDESSINSSPSPTDYVFEIMCGDPTQQQALSMLQFKDFYDPFQQSLFSGILPGPENTPNSNLNTDPFFGAGIFCNQQEQNETLEETLINSLSVLPVDGLTNKKNCSAVSAKKKDSRKRKSLHEESTVTEKVWSSLSTQVTESKWALWPNYICLYLEYTSPYDPCQPLSHNLSQMPHCYPNCLPVVSSSSISKEKCPLVADFDQFSNDTVLLLAKTKLDLNLNISDFAFNNTSFFETQTRRTIECTTTIYSFGNVVLESKEVQQALWVNEGKFMYGFVFVNQFFDAFMKGIRSLQSWDEVDIAINNLCIVQSFEDMESKYITSSSSADNDEVGPKSDCDNSPLLVMMYEFERGQGSIGISAISNGSNKVDTETHNGQTLDSEN